LKPNYSALDSRTSRQATYVATQNRRNLDDDPFVGEGHCRFCARQGEKAPARAPHLHTGDDSLHRGTDVQAAWMGNFLTSVDAKVLAYHHESPPRWAAARRKRNRDSQYSAAG
jgi:hypothetical protein